MHQLNYCPVILIFLSFLAGCHEYNYEQFELSNADVKVELFGEYLISTGLYERDITITGDGTEIYYTLGTFDQTRRSIMSVEMKGNNWQAPEIISFSGRYNDIEPSLSPDNTQLFFASDRPVPGDPDRKDYNIWVSQRSGAGWSDPIILDTMINKPGDDFFPSVTSSGKLYFTATRAEGMGREDIFYSNCIDNIYSEPVALDSSINSSMFEFNAYISPDYDLIVFSSFGRSDGMGGGDLYYSQKDKNGNWTKAVNMGKEINSDKLDFCPFIDWSRQTFYFSSTRRDQDTSQYHTVDDIFNASFKAKNGMGNIYRRGDIKSLFSGI